MHITELAQLKKQLGNHVIEFKNGKINGYTVVEYCNYEPMTVKLDKTIKAPNRALSFAGAYDLLYGKPTAPDFTKVLA